MLNLVLLLESGEQMCSNCREGQKRIIIMELICRNKHIAQMLKTQAHPYTFLTLYGEIRNRV